MNRYRTVLMVLAVCALVPAGLGRALAEEDGDRPNRQRRVQRNREGRPERPLRQMLQGLDLDEAQRDEVRQVTREHRQTVRQRHQEHAEELEQINTQIRELMERRRELMGGHPMKGLLEKIRPLLNEQQQAELDTRIKRMEARGKGNGPMGGDGPALRQRRQGREERGERGRRERRPRRDRRDDDDKLDL